MDIIMNTVNLYILCCLFLLFTKFTLHFLILIWTNRFQNKSSKLLPTIFNLHKYYHLVNCISNAASRKRSTKGVHCTIRWNDLRQITFQRFLAEILEGIFLLIKMSINVLFMLILKTKISLRDKWTRQKYGQKSYKTCTL